METKAKKIERRRKDTKDKDNKPIKKMMKTKAKMKKEKDGGRNPRIKTETN